MRNNPHNISPENRSLFDIELEYRALGDTTALYLIQRVNALEAEYDSIEENAYKEANALDDGLVSIMGIIDDIYDYVERSSSMPEKDILHLMGLIDKARDCEYDARK